MGKIVKFCAVCEENFAEKFSFCPNCSSLLTTYEMNLVPDQGVFTFDPSRNEETYKITFVENRSGKTRQALMLGAFSLVMGGAILSLVFSIYNAEAFVAGLDDNLIGVVYVPIEEPLILEPETISDQAKDSRGGGNGGNKDPNPVSEGDFANQSNDPKIAPSVTSHKLKNPEIPIEMQTTGETKRTPKNPYGDPQSKFNIPSDGPGENGGQGDRDKRGQGTSPDGDGSGPGPKGPGIGSGPIGPSSKKIDDDGNNKPPDFNRGVTVALKITSKPRAIYTDTARKNQIAGTVTLRVTFNANGSIGNIAVISGLPDGLTEQAIVAARNIQFEPAKRNGVAQTVTKQVQYTFTLY
jgi:TonB family protein